MDTQVIAAPALLTLPDGASPGQWGGDMSSIPIPDTMSSSVWEALCERMMTDIHRNHMMPPEDKEQHLRTLVLPIPGKPPDRTISVVEDSHGVYAVGATGSVLWPAALSLIEKLDKVVPANSKDLRVVELGAGLGPIGNFLRRHKGCYVALTDVTESLPLLQRNVTENFGGNPDCPEILPLRWGDAEQLQVLTVCGSYDLVVGSDITYRPEHTDDLLRSASKLLKPGGRVHISLQDRPGEAEAFRNAIARSRFRTTSFEEAPLPCSGVKHGSALEDGAALWAASGQDNVTQIFIFELELREEVQSVGSSVSAKDNNPFPGLPSTADEVEAEFFRLTGIQPDAGLRPKRSEIPAAAIEKASLSSSPSHKGTELSAKSKGIKGRIVKDYLEHGLGALLCEVDEDVMKALESKTKEHQPKTDTEKRRFAEAFYGFGSKEGAVSELAALPDADQSCGADSDVREVTASEMTASVDVTNAPPAAADTQGQSLEVQAKVKKCVPGLEWEVTINEEDRQLSALVIFGDEIWEALQGSSGSAGSKSFREAVSFELSEQELRVTYMDSAVLVLCLPRAVDPAAAVAKLSSKLRRVTVGAPLS